MALGESVFVSRDDGLRRLPRDRNVYCAGLVRNEVLPCSEAIRPSNCSMLAASSVSEVRGSE